LQNPVYPIYFLDEKEIDHQAVKKLDPKAIEKIESQKGADAVRGYGVRARFGVIKITSRKTPLNLPKNGHYLFTLYILKDSAKNVMQTNYGGSNLDTIFREILNAYTNSTLVIDNLRSPDFHGASTSMEISGAFNLIYMNANVDSVSKTVAEAIFYTSKNYQSGRFYFSGSSFSNVIPCSANDMNCIQTNLKRCTVGSIITLERCQLRNSNNTYDFISKSIKLD
jgi:hypothetical protein